MSTGPRFVTPPKLEQSGVDFLGLQQTNLDYIDDLLPGLNNVTSHVRIYALMCWICWIFEADIRKAPERKQTRQRFRQFREKIEVLFTWSHQLHTKVGALPGSRQKRPAGRGAIPLSFNDWNRKTSLVAATTYGPSLKEDNGLNFLRQPKNGILLPTERGERMAAALDARLRQCGAFYRRLINVDGYTATEPMARKLFEHWRVDRPTKTECETFAEALLGDAKQIQGDRLKDRRKRTRTIACVSAALQTSGRALSEHELRRRLTYSMEAWLPRRKEEAMDLESVAWRWRVLQARQAQRLAFEALFSWLERRLVYARPTPLSEIVSAALEIVASDESKPAWVASRLTYYRKRQAFVLPSKKSGESHLLRDVLTLLETFKTGEFDAGLRAALDLLMRCCVVTEQLALRPDIAPLLARGGRDRASLEAWSRFVSDRASQSMSEFLRDTFEGFVIGQHLAVTASRHEEGKQKLHFSTEDNGLLLVLDGDYSTLRVTPDRLTSVLSLLSECKRLQRAYDEHGVPKYSVAQ